MTLNLEGHVEQDDDRCRNQRQSTKTDIFLFLRYDVHAYLPKKTYNNMYFMKDLVAGTKKVRTICSYLLKQFILNHQVKQLIVPQYEELSINNFLGFAHT